MLRQFADARVAFYLLVFVCNKLPVSGDFILNYWVYQLGFCTKFGFSRMSPVGIGYK